MSSGCSELGRSHLSRRRPRGLSPNGGPNPALSVRHRIVAVQRGLHPELLARDQPAHRRHRDGWCRRCHATGDGAKNKRETGPANRGGQSRRCQCQLGPAVVSKAKPDGYTLLASATFLLVNPLVDTELGWRPSDFQPIARLSMTHNLFTVGGSSPWQSLADFVAAARARPGLPIGSGGVGSPQSMAHELLRVRAGLEFNVIPTAVRRR